MEAFITKTSSDPRDLLAKGFDRNYFFAKKLFMNKKKMGVLILTPFFSPNIGGVESHLDNLVSILDEKGYSVFVQTYSPITTENTPWKKNELIGNNIKINRYRWFGKYLFHKLENYPVLDFLYLTPYLFIRSFYFMITNAPKIDIIHAQGLNAGIIGIALKFIFRKRFIISLHAVYANINKNGFSGFATRLILNNAEVVLGMSKAVINQFAQYGIKKNLLNEYRYWVDTEHFKPMDLKEARKNLNIEDRFTVLFVGRLITIKGIKLLVEVAKELEHLQFLFIGTGPLEDFLKSASKQFSNIHFLGKVQNTGLPIYYNSADLLCIPSLYEEALGRVTLEAVACGIPVVGSNKGGILEVMTKEISVLVQPTQKILKETISKLSKDQSELKILKGNCRPHALKFFSKDSIKLITKHYL